MMPVIKASRLAESGVALRRHPRLLRGPGQKPEEVIADVHRPAGDDASRLEPSHVFGVAAYAPASTQAALAGNDKAPIDADAAACIAGELTRRDSYAEGYDNGFEEGQRTGWGAGHEEGLRNGLQKGSEDTRAAAQVRADALEALGAAINEACAQRRAAVEAGAIEIAYAVVLRLIGESVGERTSTATLTATTLAQSTAETGFATSTLPRPAPPFSPEPWKHHWI